MAIKELNKIADDFATTSGVQALSVRPNQPSTYGVGGLDAAKLKAFFDKFPQEVADKYNALCDILADPGQALSYIAWKDGASLADFFSTITNRELAKAINALDPTTGQAASVQDILDNIHSIVSLLDAYIGNHEADKTLADEYVQKDADGNVTVNGITANGDIRAENAEISAPRIVAGTSANLKTVNTDKLTVKKADGNLGDAEIEGDLTVDGIIKKSDSSAVNIPQILATDINATNSIHAMNDIGADGTVSAESVRAMSVTATGTVTAAEGNISGKLTVGGDLEIKGATITQSHETLAVENNLIVTNSSGANFSSSGLAIRTKGNACYGILYLPDGESGEAVYIGEGRINNGEFEFGNYVNGTFYPNTDVAVPLAARSGEWDNKSIPMWDSSKHAFVSSKLNVYELRGISEYNYEITDPSSFTTENLAQMRGNILISCDIITDEDSVTVTVPSKITAINFNDHETNYTIIGHHDCRLIGAKMGINSGYDNTISNFGSIEFCKWSGQYVNCNRIAHSELWHATNCRFITDCTPAYFETHDANFSGCSNITNVRITDLDEDYGVEFINCDHISNVSVDSGGDGKILYTNCTYVDALTCHGYGIGVPCINSSGNVSFLESAEGGSYGS